MQWDGTRYAGFSTVEPWLALNANHRVNNVAAQETKPDSLLAWYKRLIWARKGSPALLRGRFVMVNNDAPEGYVSYLRQEETQTCLVVLNLSGHDITVQFDLAAHGVTSRTARVLLSSHGRDAQSNDLAAVPLAPYEAYIGVV